MIDAVRDIVIGLLGEDAIAERAAARQRGVDQERADRHADLQRSLAARATKKRAGERALEKAQANELAKREAHQEAQQAVVQVRRDILNLNSEEVAERQAFERFMRETAPRDVLDALVRRVEDLLNRTVPTQAVLMVSRDFQDRQIPVAGDVTARRRSLYTLRNAIQNEWGLLPLTAGEFEQRFEAAIAALPPEVPPPTVEEFLRRSNAA